MGSCGVSGIDKDAAGQVVLQVANGVATVFLGSADEKVVTLGCSRVESLGQAIRHVASLKDVQGLVLIGPHEGMFCAGADIKEISRIDEVANGESFSRKGQEVFNLIADLPITTVAAISGPCLGAGYELALTCDYRVITAVPKSSIGMPQVKLGLIPAFGGTQRLPRLIGLDRALDIIVQGRVLSFGEAKKLGLVDHLIEVTEDLEDQEDGGIFAALKRYATELALGRTHLDTPTISFNDRFLTYTRWGRSVLAKKTKAAVIAKTRGHYPAPVIAVDVALEGLRRGQKNGLDAEAKAIGNLIVSPEGKSLQHIWGHSELASKIGRSLRDEVRHAKVGIIGAGVMGTGIATSCLIAGLPVVLIDDDQEALDQAKRKIESALSRNAAQGDLSDNENALERLQVGTDISHVRGSSIVIETVSEVLSAKAEVLGSLAKILDAKAILASNTSSLSISKLAAGLPGADRILGMHFFNPAEKMRLVEIVQAGSTGGRALIYASALASHLGKSPVVVRDVPAFLVNRLLLPYLMEGAHLLEEGYSSTDIDRSALAFGMPIGPLRLIDEIGLDVCVDLAGGMEPSYLARVRVPQILSVLIDQGALGRKSELGFYDYSGDKPEENLQIGEVLNLDEDLQVTDRELPLLAQRLVLSMMNEGVRSLDEEVAGVVGPEAAGQIDLATVLGIGFPAFRGGLIRYADTLGPASVQEKLLELANAKGERFLPWKGITERARRGLGFDEAV